MRLPFLPFLALPLLLAFHGACGCPTCGDPTPIVRLQPVIPDSLKNLEGVDATRYVTAGGTRDFTLVWTGAEPPSSAPQWRAKNGTVDRLGRYQAPAALGLDTITAQLPNGWEMEWTLEVIPPPSIQAFMVTPNPAPSGSSVSFNATFSSRARARLLKGETLVATSSNGTLTAAHQPNGSATYTLRVMNMAGDETPRDLQLTVQ